MVVRSGAGHVQGIVSDKDGRAVHHAAVVLMPAKAGPPRPLIAYRQGRTDQNGGFELRGIIPGSYRIYAWANLWPNQFMDSDFMSRFENRGQPLQIRERERASIDLFVLDGQ
jgi:protocatechuate 3,4-dioxygenase beta subunit